MDGAVSEGPGNRVRVVPPEHVFLLEAVVGGHSLLQDDLLLAAGWIETESGWDPWAFRYEPYFRWLPHGLNPTESMGRKCSWGLGQVMGQVAREHGFGGPFPQLCVPAINLDVAARVLRARYTRTGDWDAALAAYNGGLRGNRVAPFRNQSYLDKVRANARLFGWEG